MDPLSRREWVDLLCHEEKGRRVIQVLTEDPAPDAETARSDRARAVAAAYSEFRKLRDTALETFQWSSLPTTKGEASSLGAWKAAVATASAANTDLLAVESTSTAVVAPRYPEAHQQPYVVPACIVPAPLPASHGLPSQAPGWRPLAGGQHLGMLLMWCDELAHKGCHSELTLQLESVGVDVRKHKKADTCLRALRESATGDAKGMVTLVCSWRRRWCLELVAEMRCNASVEDIVDLNAAVLFCRTQRQYRRALVWASQNQGSKGYPANIKVVSTNAELFEACTGIVCLKDGVSSRNASQEILPVASQHMPVCPPPNWMPTTPDFAQNHGLRPVHAMGVNMPQIYYHQLLTQQSMNCAR